MSVDEDIGEITVDGANVAAALGRLEYAGSLIERRRQELDDAAGDDKIARAMAKYVGPPFRVHVINPAGLLDDDEARAALEHIARHGERTGVIGLLHGPLDEVTEALSASRALTAALMSGKGYRHVEPHGVADLRQRAAAVVLDDRFLSAVADDPGALARVVASVSGGEAAVRIAAAFRLAADVLDPEGAQ
jgi:hypothetical protein